ncbi:MAG: inositol monophosphatase [Cytophagales bacterium]|nr:MAG: inositol monophosphatase [Cytophagales bacterium]
MNKQLNLDLETLCKEVESLAKTVAFFIEQEGMSFDNAKIEYKSPTDMVSYVDKESEKMLVKGLSLLLPQAGFITEEGTVEQTEQGLKWVIDPLDGTTNFLHQLPPYSISIALMEEDEVLLGVVYEISRHESYSAWKGGGAWCNGNKIKVSQAKKQSDALLVVGFPYNLEGKKEAYFEIIKSLVGNSHGVRRLGSAAADMVYVACGRLDAYIEFNINIWDIAAGLIILEEAGGKITDFNNENKDRLGKRVLATNSNFHNELLSSIKKYWKE